MYCIYFDLKKKNNSHINNVYTMNVNSRMRKLHYIKQPGFDRQRRYN